MRRLTIFFSIIILLSFQSTAKEKLIISQWLQAGPFNVSHPLFHQTENVFGKAFTDTDLLKIEHHDLRTLYPEKGMPMPWLQGRSASWQEVLTDSNGYVILPHENSQQPKIIYLATYLNTDRWLKGKLEIKSPYILEAWLDGKRIASKATTEKEENTIGRMNPEIKLTQGNHLLIIKAFLPVDRHLDWKVMAAVELEEPYNVSNLTPNLSPSTIKNINHILDGVKITGIDPSPDGKYYIVRYSQSQPPSDQSESWVEIKRFSDNQLVHTFRNSRISRLSWLPATNAISYITSRNGKSSVHWHQIETGAQRILLEDLERFAGITWSPDESYFIYSVREEGGGSDDNLRHVLGMQDRLPGWRNRSFLFKYDLNTGVRTRLTYGNLTTSVHDISPDGRLLLIGQSFPDYTQRPYSKSNLFLMDVNTLELDTIYFGKTYGISAGFSPDGKKLLATGGPSAFEGIGENIPSGSIANNYDRQAYIMDLQTREVKSITREFNPAVSSAVWSAADNHIYLHVVEEDFQTIYRYDVKRGSFTPMPTTVDFASNMSISSRAGIIVFRGNQANSPHAFYSLDLRRNRVKLLEDPEKENYRHVQLGEVKNWNFTASSGVDVKGRYYLPPDFDPQQKYPVIVYYYGGTTPVGRTFGGRYPFNLWAGHGYIVYVLQPSGATGFGQEFSAAHVNNWGITVADEIIEGTRKFLEDHPFTDASKVGCAGASYGGFMTMLLMTRTDIFAAAISHAGISSISSYWGEGFWGYSYSAEATAGSFPWNSPEIYVNQSPLFHADKITTPLLLITGDSDTNVPPGESIQMYTALRILDRPAELVLIKGEDHHIVTYNRRIEWHNSIMAWWDKHLKDQPQWWEDIFPLRNF
jgi:dipeptidyl aminopeptidase/acylaminoacyl peptidase